MSHMLSSREASRPSSNVVGAINRVPDFQIPRPRVNGGNHIEHTFRIATVFRSGIYLGFD